MEKLNKNLRKALWWTVVGVCVLLSLHLVLNFSDFKKELNEAKRVSDENKHIEKN